MFSSMYIRYRQDWSVKTVHYARSSIHMHVCSNAVNHTSEMADALQGEFCYVQTSDGKIVSVHYGTTENDEAINIKRSIASTFQANFDRDKSDVEEADPGSVHTSHYRCVLNNL